MAIGKIERVPLRDVWKHEAYNFTAWLQDNIDVLNDALGILLSSAEREQSAGSFSVDLVAEDEKGNSVVIENQLEKSDHNHLGKLVTYLTNLDAKAAIWIVAEPRSEHINAITWLNESSADFYLVKVEGIRINESDPAPLLTLIVGPSAESREFGVKKKEMAERYAIRYEFWKQLLEIAKDRIKLHAQISPTPRAYIGTGAGKSGMIFGYGITQHEGQVELYIDRGKESDKENMGIFEELQSHKAQIEETFGEPLDWQRLEGKRACRIAKKIQVGGYRDNDKWPEIHEAMIDAMQRFEKSFRPFIKKLPI
ncbi:DUF4268 domain-containing protein [Chloroflexota bacterium]